MSKNKKTRAQASVEFLVVLSIGLIFSIFFLNHGHNKLIDSQDMIKKLHSEKILGDLITSINEVYLTGSSSSLEIQLEETINGGHEYNLEIFPDAILLTYTGRDNVEILKKINSQTLNSTIDGVIISSKNLRIVNNNGIIHITELT